MTKKLTILYFKYLLYPFIKKLVLLKSGLSFKWFAGKNIIFINAITYEFSLQRWRSHQTAQIDLNAGADETNIVSEL